MLKGLAGRWRRWALEALGIIAVVAAVQLWQARGLPEGPAPELAGRWLNGQPGSLATVLAEAGGRPVLVAFWATWCGVCKLEAGNLAAIAADSPFLGVAMSSGDAAAVAGYLRQENRVLPSFADPDGERAAAWHVRGVPTHFIVDGAGRIRFRVVGYATEWGLRARLWWAATFVA